MKTICIIVVIYIIILTIRLENAISKIRQMNDVLKKAMLFIESQEFILKGIFNVQEEMKEEVKKVKKEYTKKDM